MSIEQAYAWAPERRTGSDRRRSPRWYEWRWALGGRRRRSRRTGEMRACRVDHYPASLLAAVIVILGMSSLDAGLTLHLLELGIATEANPLMAALIHDVRLFIYLKTALTGAGIVLLVIYSEASILGVFRIRRCLYVLAALYAALVAYEVALLTLS